MEKAENRNDLKCVYPFLYFAKFMAAFLVSWGHFVTSGTFSTDLHDAGIMELAAPLLPKEQHVLWYPDMMLILKLGVPVASVGVVVFFLISGFLTPGLQRKYNGQEIPRLLLSRIARFFPGTLVCTALIGLVMFVGQGVSFPLSSYLITGLLAQTWIHSVPPITYITWYLVALMFFYLIATVVPSFSLKNITLVYAALYVLVGFSGAFEETPMAKWFDEICYVAKFCGIPLLGVAAYELKDKAWSDRLICFGWFFFLNLGVLRFEAVLHGTEHAYTIVWLYVCAFLVILLAWMIDRAGNWRGEIVSICKKIDELLLPFYLLHFSFGYNTIYLLRKGNISVYICLLAAYVVSFAAAWLPSRLTRLLVRMIACLPRLGGLGKIGNEKRK